MITLSSISDQSVAVSTATAALPFSLSGDVGTVTLTGTSYHPLVVPSVNIVFGGSGASRTVTVTPSTGVTGFATIVVTASDDNGPVVMTFLLSVGASAAGFWTPPESWTLQELPPGQKGQRGRSKTLTYSAPYPACEEDEPDAGDMVDGYSGMVVDTVSTTPRSGVGDGEALVEIKLVPAEAVAGGDASDGSEDPTPHYRRRWVNITRDLRSHPRYRQNGGANALSYRDLVDIEKWKMEDDPALKTAFKYRPLDYSAAVTLSTNAQHLAKKILLGEETYTDHVPEVSRVGLTRGNPNKATTMNKIYDAPPGFPSSKFPAGYKWKGIEDDIDQQGRTGPIEQTISFLGARYFDMDIYLSGAEG